MHSYDEVRVLLGIVFGEPQNACSGGSTGEVVELLAGYALDAESFHHHASTASIAVDHVVDLRLLAVEDRDVEVVFSNKNFLGDLHDAHRAVARKGDDVIHPRAFADGFVALHAIAGEAFLAVDVESVVRDDDLFRIDAVEGGELGAALAALSVALLDSFIPLDGVGGEALEVLFRLGDLVLESAEVFVGLEGVELGDALDTDFGEADDVLLGDFTAEETEVGAQPGPDFLDDGFPGFAFLDAAVNALLDEDLLEAGKMPLLLEFAELDLELLTDQVAGLLGAVLEDLGDAEEAGFVVLNDAGVRRDADLAIAEGVKGLQSLVGVGAGGKVDADLDVLGGAILDLGDAHLALLVRF